MLFAMKRIEISSNHKENVDELVREIDLMKTIYNKNIVEYIGSFVDEISGHLFIFQEWVPGTSYIEFTLSINSNPACRWIHRAITETFWYIF